MATMTDPALAQDELRALSVRSNWPGVIRLAARHVLAAKEREAAIVLAADLDWVLVRPGRIVKGARSGRVRGSLDGPPRPKVTDGDVADFMLRAAINEEWIHRAPFVG